MAIATSPRFRITASAQSAAPAGNAERGQKFFEVDGCYQCHGHIGHGGGRAGPRLAKTKLPFDAFLQQLRRPSNQMPPYEAAILSDQMVADIYAYVLTLPGPVDMEKVNLPH
jgi:ubiquinol-cytochrome c reductase cytochrome c subunit